MREPWGIEGFIRTYYSGDLEEDIIMLVLLFYLGKAMYAITCEKVREIAPMVNLQEFSHAPDFFAGLFNYRGMIVPVIDLRQLIYGQACEQRLSTRIILIDYVKPDNTLALYGVMAERVTEAAVKPQREFIASSVRMQDAPYLGGILMEQNAMIQFIDVERLPESLNLISMLGNVKDITEDVIKEN
jgi:chemotaxis-related protein WspB